VIELGYYKIDVKNTIQAGETIEYIGPEILYIQDSSFSLYDENNKCVTKVHHGKPSFIKTDKPIEPGYILRKKV
jgi:putative protease